jgi:methylenetetrahydrofolate reductase (NADPH)
MREFNDDLANPEKFVITLELVPGRESNGRTIDTIKGMCRDAAADGRITAVSITDNPGGNPALSPDALGRDILHSGMDVIVHFTCRDTNRVGMESRALQLAHMGMKNILALTGDYSGKGFGGRATPVFDFDSVVLSTMFRDLNRRLIKTGHSSIFITGCAVSPFKYTEAETWVQYRKLARKIEAGASFAITQLGYDVDKYAELLRHTRERGETTPLLASLYLLDQRAAAAMHAGRVPGVHVSAKLARQIASEWQDPVAGRAAAIERTARLGAVLQGLGYRGIHLGGVHDSFATVAAILDRMAQLAWQWQEYLGDFQEPENPGFYLYPRTIPKEAAPVKGGVDPAREASRFWLGESCHYLLLRKAHDLFFDKQAALAPMYRKLSSTLERSNTTWLLKRLVEDPCKKLLLSCQGCGDCGIQHVGFLCPESGCPKHTRNGACGGSNHGYCEVNKEKLCVWVRAYQRMKRHGEANKLNGAMVPPRLWELKDTSSWVNFHLDRDHQRPTKCPATPAVSSGSGGISTGCRPGAGQKSAPPAA